MSDRTPWRKRLSHRLKAGLYARASLDEVLDHWLLEGSRGGLQSWLAENLLLRLLPERRLRETPFRATDPARGPAGAPRPSARVRILSLTPPEDTSGGSRPAQLAAELHRRGFTIEWLWALPIFPWPRRRRPKVPNLFARSLGERAEEEATRTNEAADLVLLEAPHPDLWRAAQELPRSGPIVYEAIDLWDSPLGRGWYAKDVEDRVLAEADHLLASSSLLVEEIARRSGRQVELAPNAIDLDRFRRGGPRPDDLHAGAPTVVFVGALWGDWVDLALVAALADALPEATIHLIGPLGGRAVPQRPNLHVLGPKPRSRIPAYLAAADVAIVPFTPERLAAAVSPLKVFEYLALERPVVATPLPELANVPGVTIASGAAPFVEAVRAARSKPFPQREVRAYLERHTWAARVDRLLEITRLARR